MGDQFAQFTSDELTALEDGLSRLVATVLEMAADPDHPMVRDQAAADDAADQLDRAAHLLVAIDQHRGQTAVDDDDIAAAVAAVRRTIA